jgi:alpha-maltose-1-phosphate synthase
MVRDLSQSGHLPSNPISGHYADLGEPRRDLQSIRLFIASRSKHRASNCRSPYTRLKRDAQTVSKLTVFVGGSVGSDPRSPKTWSGSCAPFVDALNTAGILNGAVGIKVPRFYNSLLRAKNFNRNRSVWRSHYYFDPAYRDALTRVARRVQVHGPFLLQLGHMFSLPQAFPDKRCISYHDGNLSERLKSGFGLAGISAKRIDQALRYEERVANQMEAVFTFSDYLRQSFIADYHVPANRVFNVGGGINLTEIPAMRPDKTYTAPRILFIGADFRRKGGPELLEAFRIVRESVAAAELHIAGPASLETVPEGVYFHGHLSKADPAQRHKLESLFRDSTLFVLPSLYEPFGIAPLEAMVYQLPCLVTDGWALRETVTPGLTGDLVAKGAVEPLATKIIELLSDPERLVAMGRRGREQVLGEFTWEAVARRIRDAMISI